MGANADDGNGQALRVGDYKLVYEKAPDVTDGNVCNRW